MGLDKNLARSIRELDEYELRRLVIYAQGILASVDGPRFDHLPDSAAPTMTLRQQTVRCGKDNCRKCPHGPYWYGYWREGGKARSKYIGKELPPGLEA